AKANQAIDFFLKREVTTNSAAHAFADQECRVRLTFLSRRFQRRAMRCDQLRQRIGPFTSRTHVIVVESLDLADLRQSPFPILHPRMRRRRTGPWSKKNQSPAHVRCLLQRLSP